MVCTHPRTAAATLRLPSPLRATGPGDKLSGRGAVAVITCLACAGLAIGGWQLGVLAAPERATLDARFQLRGDEPAPASIVIVVLDEETIARLSSPPPYPRSYYARLIDTLHRDGARLIAFDIAFDRPTSAAEDRSLRAAARRAAPVLLGTAEIGTGARTLVLGGLAQQQRIGARVAATLLPSDPDGLLRRVPYAVKGLPTLAVAGSQMLDKAVSRSRFPGSGALIDYAGGSGAYATVSLAAVLAGEVSPRRFAGKTILVGASARTLQDIHPTPFGQMAGVEVQANALRTVLAGLPLAYVSGLATVLLTLLLALVAPLAAMRLGVIGALALSLLAAIAFVLACQLAFAGGDVLNVTTPLLGWLLSLAAVVTFGYLGADRERQRLRTEFAAFAPGVVDAVLDADATVALTPTDVIGGYRILDLIGRGGMAVVYRATQVALDRQVALKLIAPDYARSPLFRDRFLRESRAAAAVEHPNVVPIYEAGDDAGLLFIALRYIDGVDLEAVLDRLGPLDAVDAVRIVAQLAGALDAAHAKGVVHRDVKPSNVLLEDELARAYLTDFGIARAAGSVSEITSAGSFVGSADYAAPEQIAGAAVDGRADVYALGALLYRSLSGRVPYVRDSLLAKLSAHADAPAPRVSDAQPALAAFDAVIAHAMAKQPSERPASAGELALEAEAALASISGA